MLSTRASVTKDVDTGGAVESGVRSALFDAADRGFAVSQEKVPDGATSTLRQSGFEPTELDDGSVIWGYRASYAQYVEEGTRPHWAPIEPLKLWAQRVLGNERAAWAVQQKIADEGTEGQGFVAAGVQAMKLRLQTKGLKSRVEKHL